MNCPKCNKEIENNNKFCPFCGEALTTVAENSANEAAKAPTEVKKKSKKKLIVIIIIAAVLCMLLAIGAVIGVIFGINAFRVNSVIDKLEGKTYVFYEETNYTYVENSYSIETMKFVSDEEIEVMYYYSNIDTGNEYTHSYDVKFKLDGTVILEVGSHTYELNFDAAGNVESFTSLDGVSVGNVYYEYTE